MVTRDETPVRKSSAGKQREETKHGTAAKALGVPGQPKAWPGQWGLRQVTQLPPRCLEAP